MNNHIRDAAARVAAPSALALAILLGASQQAAAAPAARRHVRAAAEPAAAQVPTTAPDEPWNVSLSGEYAYLQALSSHGQQQAELGAIAQRRGVSPLVRDVAYGLARQGTQLVEELRAFALDLEMPSPISLSWLHQRHLQRLRDAQADGECPAIDAAYLRLARLAVENALLASEDAIETCTGRRAIAAHARRTRDVLEEQLAYLDQVVGLRGGELDEGGALGPVPGDDAALP